MPVRGIKNIMIKKIFVFLYIIFPFFISAQEYRTPQWLVPILDYAPEIVSRSAFLIDAHTGALLYSKNSDDEIPPASLTKLMTMHLLMNEVEAGRSSYDELIPITVESWAQSQPPRSSLMFLEPGQIVTLREIMLGLAVSSGNDAAVAAALRLAPNMAEFAAIMNAEARRMGMSVTRFTESSGISEENITTAAEFAHFCRQYVNLHPDSMKNFHSVLTFSYPLPANVPERYRATRRTYTQNNQNSLLWTFRGVDGLKTGFIEESGNNIALTAVRNETRFILVLLGAPSGRAGRIARAEDAERLLTWAYDNFKTVKIPPPGRVEVPVWKGKENTVLLDSFEPLDFTSRTDRASDYTIEVVIPEQLIAPIPEGFTAGYRLIKDQRGELRRIPLITTSAVERAGVFKRIWHSIVLFFSK